MLDATTPGTPGYGDGKCTLATDCLGLQIDLEVATRGLRVGFGVKPSTRGDKAVLPSGTVRLLALYLMGRLSVRVELREEFPFVGIVSLKGGVGRNMSPVFLSQVLELRSASNLI